MIQTPGPELVLTLGLASCVSQAGNPVAFRTRPVEVSEQARTDNAGFFASHDVVPEHALTGGLMPEAASGTRTRP